VRKVTTVYEILKDLKRFSNKEIKLAGWVRNNRDQKKFGFINFNDGSAFSGVQIVYADHLENFEEIQKLNVGTSIEVVGDVLLTPNRPQPFEIQAKRITVLGPSDETYPIQPKRHTREFLRENAHLRVRTNLFSAVFRVRSAASFAIHQFFKERNFVYVHTPLITASDGEGAGQMFGVTTLPLDKVPKTKEGEVDYKKDFFGKKTFLTVTGQLQVETYAMAFRNVYTFGPTFRAEHSMTQRHLAEFWMIEPEMAFADLEQMMEVIEDMVKYIINYVMKELPDDMEFFNKYVDNTLFDRLNSVVNSKFAKITHKEAIDILLNSKERFENKPEHGKDLGREHEKYLTDIHFSTPVFVTDWPKDIKAFYMRLNEDNETVRAVDLLVPGSGELVGGSQREERLDQLLNRMKEMNVPADELWWYLDLRRYGGCVHSGFGMGFERMVMYLTGVENIRDVIPFPRTPNNAEF
jgi:asparaginyl-tRNA synthetase